MVLVGETEMEVPLPAEVVPHPPVYHCQFVAPFRFPATERVVLVPLQTVDDVLETEDMVG